MAHSAIANLKGWTHEPTTQAAILDFIGGFGGPVTCDEITTGTDFPKGDVGRALSRLHDKGLVTRHKLPMHMTRPVPMIRNCFVYELAEDA